MGPSIFSLTFPWTQTHTHTHPHANRRIVIQSVRVLLDYFNIVLYWGLFSLQQRDQCWSTAVLTVYPAALNKIRDPALWLPILLSSWCLTTWRPTAHSHNIWLILNSLRPLTYLFVMQVFCTSSVGKIHRELTGHICCVHDSLKLKINSVGWLIFNDNK